MNFMTYFDVNYADKGWACHHTLYKFLGEELKLYVFALDEKVYEQAKEKKGVVPIRLREVEEKYPELKDIKNTRLAKEYYATMTPIFPLYLFEKYNDDLLFYTDADIAFYSNPKEMLGVLGNKSLMVVDHGIEPPRAKVRFNVGILAYRNDENCKEFLNWWKEKCIEWCEWKTMPDGRCADQGYLNIIHNEPERFKNTLAIQPLNTGINVSPWCAENCNVIKTGDDIIINNKTPLICYHFHEFKLTQNGYYPTGWKLGNGLIQNVYEPYYKLIKSVK